MGRDAIAGCCPKLEARAVVPDFAAPIRKRFAFDFIIPNSF
jgi:hypothetical protein